MNRIAPSPLPVLPSNAGDPTFDLALGAHGLGKLTRGRVTTLQVNVGRLCNLACHHCHVEAGPKRTESLSEDVADRLLELLAASPEIEVLDLTGGAPEMNPQFRRSWSRRPPAGPAGDRPLQSHDPRDAGLRRSRRASSPPSEVEIVASLPCYTLENVDQQRGRGTFDDSIAALQR